MKQIFLFDVDGVLCDRGQKIDPSFQLWFKQFIEGKDFFFVTGSGREKTIEQLGNEIVDKCRISYHCMGNNIWIDGREISVNQFVLKKEELELLENLVNNHNFPKKTGSHIDYRKGSINFSIVGRNASIEDRKIYMHFDKVFNDRIRIIDKITKKFPRLEAYLGGDVSVDICLQGGNKSQVMQMLPPYDKIYFFGDRCDKLGIDYPLTKYFTKMTLDQLQSSDAKRYPYEYFQIDKGYMQTWDILKVI